jgi:hypothetical protein
MPCPTTMWCANFSDRWSTSLVNHESPTKDDGGLNLYNNLMPGFILAPTGNVLNCAFSQVCLQHLPATATHAML